MKADSKQFEWSPFEWGSWDRGFVPTKYVGTVPSKDNTANECVVNYDQARFVLPHDCNRSIKI